MAGAAVFLGDGEAWHASAVSDARGRFALRAPAPGSYRLRVQRIGYPDFTTAAFTLAAGEVRGHPLSLPVAPVTLEGIVAEATPRCEVRPREGLEMARVWEEARKALFLTALTAADSALEFEYATFDRVLDRDGRDVLRDSVAVARIRGALPFASIPADSLARRGYVRASQPFVTFYAPDAEVLLSESFLDTHCFQLRAGRGEEAGMIGLAFQPVRERRLPDVEGVLWLDRRTAELRHLEFGYTRVRTWDREMLGGSVYFTRLPTGAWIVHNWRLRWPVAEISFGRRPQDTRFGRHANVREVGGTVVDVRTVASPDGP